MPFLYKLKYTNCTYFPPCGPVKCQIWIQIIREEILNSRTEIKNCIVASEARFLLKIEDLKNTVANLERENSEIKEELEYLKRAQNKKNIVVFGLKKKREEVVAEILCEDLRDLLGVNLDTKDFVDVYPLGKSDVCPIKIEFVSNIKKREVLKHCSRLKGTNISIAHDLTLTKRSENKILRKHLYLAKQEGSHKEHYIRRNKLIVDGVSYGVDDLEKDATSINQHNSAPSTPTAENKEKFPSGSQKVPTTPRIPATKKLVPMVKALQEKPRTRSINKN
ncbi:hypothetical protein JTB14_007101 [Gonioctena quinquepunctata]|nr:hypothetical protein JTB14_007101 [Gonioctena quinquepunctata]